MFTIWILLFGGKFLILEVVDIVFGDHVELGHLLEVILIVVTMMIAGHLMQVIYDRLGVDAEEAGTGSVIGPRRPRGAPTDALAILIGWSKLQTALRERVVAEILSTMDSAVFLKASIRRAVCCGAASAAVDCWPAV